MESTFWNSHFTTTHADDYFIIRINNNLAALITDMEKSLEATTKWLKKSGLKVNESKTEVCVFYHKNTPKIEIILNNVIYYQIKRYDESFKSII